MCLLLICKRLLLSVLLLTTFITNGSAQEAQLFIEYRGSNPKNEAATLKGFAKEVKKTPSAQAYVIVYGGQVSYAGEAQEKADEIKNTWSIPLRLMPGVSLP